MNLPSRFARIDRSAAVGYGLFLVTVLIGYSSLLFRRSGTIAEQAALIALGVVFSIFSMTWFTRCDSGKAGTTGYIVTQLAIGGAICWLGYRVTAGNIWIVPLPMISHAFILLSRPRALAVTGLVVLIFGVAIGLNNGLADALRSMLSYLPGAFFVAVFSWIAVEQGRARLEIETLAVELREANRKLAEYAGQVEELATTRERNRLAREVHDSLGHYLTVVNMQLEAARAVMQRDPAKAAEAMLKAQTLTKEGLTEVRRSVAALRAGPMDNRSLADAITALAADSRASGLAVDLTLSDAVQPLAPQTELLLYRAAQEGLTNVRKHSNAARAMVTLQFDGGRALLTVRDDGQPRPQAEGQPGSGFGLMGLRERAQLLGGSVSTVSTPGGGFALTVEAPLTPQAGSDTETSAT